MLRIQNYKKKSITPWSETMAFNRPLFAPAFSMIVAGPSKAGKTVFVTKFVKHTIELMEEPPLEIMWCYSEIQPGYTELMALPNVQLIEGLPNLDGLKADKDRPKLIIFDDMMTTFEKNPSLVTLFVKGCHHWHSHCTKSLFQGSTNCTNKHQLYGSIQKSQ